MHDAQRSRALQAADVAIKGLDITSSVTWTRSIITANSKWQPRVLGWRDSDRWPFTGGLRYSGMQYGMLDNTGPNGATYTGVSKFLVVDVRTRYQATISVVVSAGIDNLNNERYGAFHPYTQRMFVLELKAKF